MPNKAIAESIYALGSSNKNKFLVLASPLCGLRLKCEALYIVKNIIFLLSIIILISSCENNPIKSDLDLFDDSNLSDSLKYLYHLDAYGLALRDMKENDDDDTYLFEYEISKELYQKYYRGIISNLNSNYTSEIDSIKNIYKIHTWRYPL